ncbi:MAG: CHASE domain-containing protein [Betaproteobacteria bacterium]|nr:CHASE domain-containing protein [Betaproteobacteria bacterium]
MIEVAKLRTRIAAELSVFEPHYRALALSVALILAAAYVYSAWSYASRTASNEARLRFDFRASQIEAAVQSRLMDYEQVLSGTFALLAASHEVNPREWRTYLHHLAVAEHYPGMLGIGYLAVEASERKAVRAAARQPSATYLPVTYVWPFAAPEEEGPREEEVSPAQVLSDPAAVEAMARARDTGLPALSGQILFDSDRQGAILLFVPVFKPSANVTTVSRRQAAVTGYVYTLFRINGLMHRIVGEVSDIRLRVFDGAPGRITDVLFDSKPAATLRSGPSEFVATLGLPLPGREWTLEVQSLPVMDATIDRHTPWIVAVEGGIISALAIAIIWSLATLRARAADLARGMTRDLRESRERLALAIEGSNQALFDWDVRTGRVTLNEQWSRITGGRTDMTTARELIGLVHPDDLRHVLRQTRDLLQDRLPFYHVEHRVRTAAGNWRWISSRAKVVERDGSGRPTRVAGTNLDITPRKEMEGMKNEFIATVSHELRTPLTAIVGALGLLRQESSGKLSDGASLFLNMAQQNSDRLAALIDDILAIEKIEAGTVDFRLAPVALRPLLERAISLNTPYARRFDVRLELELPLPEVSVTGDADRLLQVMANLLSNAAKFSPTGATVSVACAVLDNAVRVTVTDRGPGIPEEFRRRIFQKFAQADSGDTRQKGGTGLGLSICKAIVERLGGTIGFVCAPGRGTTFHFDLPLRA